MVQDSIDDVHELPGDVAHRDVVVLAALELPDEQRLALWIEARRITRR